MAPSLKRLLIVITLMLSLPGCMGWGDAFNPPRKVVGDYGLERFEAGQAYYLCVKGHCGGQAGGVLDGSVKQIGWADGQLVVLMNGPADYGWRIVDVNTAQVEGPLSDEAFAVARKSRATLARVELLEVGVAWKKLSYF
jgi:hypothetical protein